jgi:HlyD family secretion protein
MTRFDGAPEGTPCVRQASQRYVGRGFSRAVLVALAVATTIACSEDDPEARPHASGYVEATEVRVASKVPGRVLSVAVTEGQRVTAGQTLIQLSSTDSTLALARLEAERQQADAQLRLVQAGSRREDITQAEAQAAAAESERATVATELAAAKVDADRFEQLVQKRAGSEKQRDDAVLRRVLAESRLKAADDRVAAARAQVARLRAGSRVQEVEAARARLSAIDAQIATINNDIAEATIASASDGIVSSRLVEPGELVVARVPLLVIVDLDRAWATAYVEEPRVAAVKIGQAATVMTDGGDRLEGKVTFIAPRAEFTPRNVQTASERAKLVYRVKVSVDNKAGVLKPGMPVEVDFGIVK